MIRRPCWDGSEDLLLPLAKAQEPGIHLDLPAAFDTVAHGEMWPCLRTLAGVDGVALEWFQWFWGEKGVSLTFNFFAFWCFLTVVETIREVCTS